MTKKAENLKNPPVIEAVFDVAIEPNNDIDINTFSISQTDFRKTFPQEERMNLFEGAFHIPTAVSHSSSKPLGFLYKTDSGKELTQFRINGFSYHKLAPYEGWNKFLNAAITYWEKYRSIQQNLKVTRLGLRYINIINVLEKKAKGKLFYPSLINSKCPAFKDITDLSYRYETGFQNLDSVGAVQFGRIKGEPDYLSFLLDIDVYKKNIPTNIDGRTIKHHLQQMREAKNSIFFNTLTDKALEGYK